MDERECPFSAKGTESCSFSPVQRSRVQRLDADEGYALPVPSLLRGLSPDLSGRVCRTAADNRCAREAQGQVDGAFSLTVFMNNTLGLGLQSPTLGIAHGAERMAHGAERERRKRHALCALSYALCPMRSALPINNNESYLTAIVHFC